MFHTRIFYTIDNCDAFFYSTVCHVCKEFGKGVNLKTCGGCGLIYYCCIDHQKVHWSKHRDFCKVVQRVRKNDAVIFSVIDGERAKIKLLRERVTRILGRKLNLYEIQMFIYARICRFCGEINDELEDCPKCLCVSFCKNHAHKHEEDACYKYKMAFQAELLLTLDMRVRNWRYLHNFQKHTLDSNIEAFIRDFSIQVHKDDMAERTIWEIRQAEHFTRVLSVYQGLKRLGYNEDRNRLALDVIAANENEVKYFVDSCQLLLHIYPSLRCLHVTLIGPELDYTVTCRQSLCLECQFGGAKHFHLQQCNMVYAEYVEYERQTKADCVVGFNCRFHEGEIIFGTRRDTWISSIPLLAEEDIPVILTCHSQYEVTLTTEKINEVLQKKISYHCEKNPFAGLRFFREYELEFEDIPNDKEKFEELIYYPVYVQNQYLLVYKTLCTEKRSLNF